MLCRDCNKEFKLAKNVKYQRFCSISCRTKFWHRKENRKGNNKICLGCTSEFKAISINQQYCSSSCAAEYRPRITYRIPAKNNPKYARELVYKAVVSKRLKPKPCEICGLSSQFTLAHHRDYSKPYDVNWLCPSCHMKVHIAVKELILC